jgi:hypothetical protein
MRKHGESALSDALDRLYGTAFDGFVAARRTIAAELKARGEVDAARALAAAAKPTRTAWALNDVARRNPERVRAVFQARDAAAAAQTTADAEAMRAATREYRRLVGELVRDVGDVLEAAGARPSSAILRRVGETIQAAGAERSEAREQLLAGRLLKDVEVDDPFGGAEADGVPEPSDRLGRAQAGHAEAAARSRAEARQIAEQQERERRKLAWERARERIVELEAQARETRAAAREAEVAAARADDEARRARRAADDVQKQLDKARDEERALR